MEEIYKDIKDLEGKYQVSNFGNILSLNYRNTGRAELMSPGKRGGYLRVNLCKNGKPKNFLVHRLVAETFLPNPNNLPCVNHKDQTRTNNRVDNLEWCTYEYNINYGTRNERVAKANTNGKRSKKVLQFTLDGEFVREWESTRECERNGFDHSGVMKCCNGKLKTHKGFRWMYK